MALRKMSFAVAARVFAAIILISSAVLLWSSHGARAAPQNEPRQQTSRAGTLVVDVVDASTIEDAATARRYRLQNVQAPATGARCAAERELGERTAAAALALIGRARQLDIHPNGAVDTDGARLAFVVLDGRDLGELLMAQGLARRERAPREPWCDSDGNLIL
jgi:endonuclease YncB( thermonuclease family)